MDSSSFDLESLVHLEQSFFDAGYADGHAHGRTHGLIEGRALGREKGYEMWEEIGFYEGFARVWGSVFRGKREESNTTESRVESHIRNLLDLISQFPRVNPPAGARQQANDGDSQVDVAALLSKIRSRYKVLCATLGIRPRLRVAGAEDEGTRDMPEVTMGKVWKLDGRPAGSTEMSF